MRLSLALLSSVFLVVGQAQADVSYQYVTDSTSYSGANGSTVDVNVYLQETLTSGSTSLITSSGGLQSFGVASNVVGTGNSSVSSFAYNPLFGQQFTPKINYSGSGNNVEADAGVTVNDPPFPGVPLGASSGGGASSSQVYLGTIAITVGPGTTTYNLTSLADSTVGNPHGFGGAGNGNTLTHSPAPPNQNDLDTNGGSWTGANANSTYQFTVSGPAVPEPGSMILTGLAASVLGFGRWMRRRRHADEGETVQLAV